MNGSQAESAKLLAGIKQGLGAIKKAQVVVCPPSILIPLAAKELQGTTAAWGGQNLDTHKSGAFTGEISGPMLKDAGCSYVIVGHSERRAMHGETDELVAEKFKAAQEAGLIPILCVGELLAEREANQTEAVVARQLDAIVNLVGVAALAKSVVAYEPVWAIGTGKTASPQQAQDVHRFIRTRVAGKDAKIADSLKILYGGSMKGSNAKELIAQPDIDGGLIGGASLVAEEFLIICRAPD